MKKKRIEISLLALVLLLVLAFCGMNRGEEPVAPTEPPATIPATQPSEPPAPTEPEWEAGLVRADFAEGIYDIFAAGTAVDVIGQFKEYYVVAGEEYDLLVEKRFIRMENEDPFQEWTAYARSGAEVFDSVYMRKDPIASLGMNTTLTVLEGKGDWIYAKWSEGEGYLLKERISEYYMSPARPSYEDENPSYDDGGSGDDSGGSSGGGGGGGSSSAPMDGTDVDIGALAHHQVQGGVVLLGLYYGPEQEPGFMAGKGTIIADDVEAYLILRPRDSKVKVTEYGDAFCTVWLENDLYFKLPSWLVRLENGSQYESWPAYSSYGAVVYTEYQMRNEKTVLDRNTEIVVLDEIPAKLHSYYHPGCFVVLVDGEVGYMRLDSVSETKFAVPHYDDDESYSYDDGGSGDDSGGSSGGSSGGGSGGGGGGSSADVWTPPVL